MNKRALGAVKAAMKGKLLAFLMISAALAGMAPAKDHNPPLEPETARKLISRIQDTRINNISIGSIVGGKLHAADGFVYSGSCRVTAVVKVPENGVIVSKVHHYDFLWNCDYGWFHQQKVQVRGLEALRIWSKRCGDFTVK